MIKLRKSRFETFILALVLSANTTVLAAEKCEKLFKPTIVQSAIKGILNLTPSFFSKNKNTIVFNNQQRLELTEVLTSAEYLRPYGLGRGTDNPLFIFKWRELSPQKRECILVLLDNAPSDISKLRDYLTRVLELNELPKINSNNFLELVISNWYDAKKFSEINTENFSNWISNIEQKYIEELNQGLHNEQNLSQKIVIGNKINLANIFWKNSFGIKQLETKYENGSASVLVNSTWLKIQINEAKKTAKVLVPRNLIKHAAWNPIYSEVLQAKIAAGARSPEVYPGFIGANGIFYLSDGNHRFILDQKPEVWIEMSSPISTSSMAITFDAMGIRQPSPEDLVQLHNNTINLQDLVGEALAKAIVYH